MTTRNCLEPQICLMEKGNGKSSRLKLQSRRHLYCHVDGLSIWCSSSHGLSAAVQSRSSLTYTCWAREIKSKEINVHFVYPMSLFMDKTGPDLAFTNLLLPTRSIHEHWGSQIHQDVALLSHTTQGHLDLASKSPSSAEAFPRFPMSPAEQINKFSTLPSFLILLRRWSSQRQSPSLLYPPQAHNSVSYCCKGFTICMRLLQIFSFSQG